MRRKAIRLRPDEDVALRTLYLSFGYPTDQYARRPKELERLTDAFNTKTEHDFSSGELLHYMVTKRKSGTWVTFGDDDYHRLKEVSLDFLLPDEWTALEECYLEINEPSDNLAFDSALAKDLSARFFAKTGRHVWGRMLFAAIMARRKRGRWVKIRRDDLGFGDIGLAEAM